MAFSLVPPHEPVIVAAGGLVLREWHESDAGRMVALFDTEEMDRRTPLASPFDREEATSYVQHAHRARAETGALQLAITEDGGEPLGEVLAFSTGTPDTVELAYAVGAAHRGRGLVRRAVVAVLELAAAHVDRAQLVISIDNLPSQRVALATGFARTDLPLVERRRKGYVLEMATWERDLHQDPR